MNKLGIALIPVIITNLIHLQFMKRKGGRVVECAGLEIRYTVIPYRGFKSHPFRHQIKRLPRSRALRKNSSLVSLP